MTAAGEVIQRARLRLYDDPLFAMRVSSTRIIVRADAVDHRRRLTDDELNLIELAAAVALVVAELDPGSIGRPAPTELDRLFSADRPAPDSAARLRDLPTGEPSSRPIRTERDWQ